MTQVVRASSARQPRDVEGDSVSEEEQPMPMVESWIELNQLVESEDWEESLSQAELRDRQEARAHIEKLLHMPECVPIAIQCELERIRANIRTKEIRRDNRAKLMELRSRRNAGGNGGGFRLVHVVQVASIVVTAALTWWSISSMVRSVQQHEKLLLAHRRAIEAIPMQQSVQPSSMPPSPTATVASPAPLPPPSVAPASPPQTTTTTTSVNVTRTACGSYSQSGDENVRYVIVKQKM